MSSSKYSRTNAGQNHITIFYVSAFLHLSPILDIMVENPRRWRRWRRKLRNYLQSAHRREGQVYCVCQGVGLPSGGPQCEDGGVAGGCSSTSWMFILTSERFWSRSYLQRRWNPSVISQVLSDYRPHQPLQLVRPDEVIRSPGPSGMFASLMIGMRISPVLVAASSTQWTPTWASSRDTVDQRAGNILQILGLFQWTVLVFVMLYKH